MPKDLLRRGQLQVGESIIVIILILIIGVFVLVFTAKTASQKYQVQLGQYEELNTIEVAQVVTSLYELKCAKEGLRTTCVDKHKANAMAEVAKGDGQQYYYDLFKSGKITLEEVYPKEQNTTLYWRNATTLGRQQSQAMLVIPVSIHNATADTMSFGVLRIERYYDRSQGGNE